MANRKDLSKVTDVSRAPSTVKKALIIYAEKEKVFEKKTNNKSLIIHNELAASHLKNKSLHLSCYL